MVMPWTFHDPLNFNPTDRPPYVTATSPDGSYRVRVAVEVRGDATEALRQAQETAQRILEEQYPAQEIRYDTVDVTAFGARYQMTLPIGPVREITAREYGAYQQAIVYDTDSGSPTYMNFAVRERLLTPEQEEERRRARARIEEEDRLRRERRRTEDERREQAQKVAMETLRRMLSKEQILQISQDETFLIKGSEGNTYQLYIHDYSGNIWYLDPSGRRTSNFCCHPRTTGVSLNGETGRLPLADAIIAQKLALESNEIQFLRTTVVNSGPIPPVKAKHQEPNYHVEQRCVCPECTEHHHVRHSWSW